MPRTAIGTVQYRPGRSNAPGKWFGRITCIDSSRPWVELGPWPNSPQGRARAKETARAYTERFRAQAIVGAPRRGPKAVADRAAHASEAGRWWAQYTQHRAGLNLISIDGAYRTHIAPIIDKLWADVTSADCERLRDALDAKARAGGIASKTAFNAWSVWTTAAKAASGQWKKDKSRKLRARDDNPCAGIAAPDRDGDKELQWLYPNEFLALVACEAVPREFRQLYALATYLFLRGGELKALTWSDVDIERGIISVRRSYDRHTGRIKQTKTGNKGMRRFAVEPELLPLLRTMHVEASGQGAVVDMRQQKWWAADLRKHMEAAGIQREALFATDDTRKRLRFHDLRGTGLTWMAIRGDDPLKIQQRAGHRTFEMTLKYIRTAEAVGEVIGEVFPPLPEGLVAGRYRQSNRPSDLQPIESIVEAPGIEPFDAIAGAAGIMPIRRNSCCFW
jgi:integrase